MKAVMTFLIISVMIFCLSSQGNAEGTGFTKTDVTGRIHIVRDSDGGESQLVIESEKGLVVFDSFWSEIAARRYREGIARVLGRDDFIYLIDAIDRLDLFGGNAAYGDVTIVGHESFIDKYRGREKEVDAEISELVKMWRWKEEVSHERIPEHEPGSEEEKNEKRWAENCRQRAEELENGFSLVLPDKVYSDRMTLDLGDITLELIWFGRAGHDGMSVAVVPEEKIAILPSFIMHPHHLAPYPMHEFATLDVPRWIEIFEEILEGEDAVEKVICGINTVYTPEKARAHLTYIRRLWESVRAADAEGLDLPQIHRRLSLDGEFSFVKDMGVYIDGGDEWTRPQHYDHTRLFFLQGRNLASEIIRRGEYGSARAAIEDIRRQMGSGVDIYIEEAEINRMGYGLINASRYADAIELLGFNAETFPRSANAWDSLAEAYMKSGDTEKAVTNYRKSLELNPDNENAKEMLKQLE
ncbi:MAG TPA: tetratricopeptide repeat protein [Candidatus Krumholzibacterium sp.]|nr:tetratricopeptide repeat protein [Candidatus Krumholzibacterium sp.]